MSGWTRSRWVNWVRDERGSGLLVVLLLLGLLASMMIWRLDLSATVTHTNVDLQEALDRAVKAAAAQVSDRSQAEGNPHIVTAQAHETFRKVLADNLVLSEVTLEPFEGSPLAAAPAYSFVVYNGDEAYAAHGSQGAYRYDFDGRSLSSYPVVGYGVPQCFAVRDLGTDVGAGGVFNVTLDAPGCVVVARAPIKTSQGPVEVIRWASAEIKEFFSH